jgi:fatty acid/phospholipid biosynthesis enzyme
LGAFSLAIDAMGGDHAPESILDGLELAAERHPQARFLLVGDEARIGGRARAASSRGQGLQRSPCARGPSRAT